VWVGWGGWVAGGCLVRFDGKPGHSLAATRWPRPHWLRLAALTGRDDLLETRGEHPSRPPVSSQRTRRPPGRAIALDSPCLAPTRELSRQLGRRSRRVRGRLGTIAVRFLPHKVVGGLTASPFREPYAARPLAHRRPARGVKTHDLHLGERFVMPGAGCRYRGSGGRLRGRRDPLGSPRLGGTHFPVPVPRTNGKSPIRRGEGAADRH